MKQKISPGMAAVIVVVAVVVLVGLFYKMNFAGPPPAPPIPMAISGGAAKPLASPGPPGVGGQGLPGGENNGSGAPTPGGGMMSPSLPGGGGPSLPGGGGMAPSLPTGPPR